MESVVSSEEKWRVVRKWLEKGEIDMNPADLYISAFRNGVRVNQKQPDFQMQRKMKGNLFTFL